MYSRSFILTFHVDFQGNDSVVLFDLIEVQFYRCSLNLNLSGFSKEINVSQLTTIAEQMWGFIELFEFA